MASLDVDLLRSAIAEGRSAGLERDELQRAQDLLALEEKKLGVIRRLEAATAKKHFVSMRMLLKEGESLGLGRDKLQVIQAAHVLEEHKLVSSIEDACATRTVKSLSSAIAAGERAGLDRGQLDRARNILAEEERKAAVAKLEAVVQQRDIPSLQSALQEGERVGLDASQLKAARATLSEAALSQQATQASMQASMQASEERLRAAIAKAERVGLTPEDLRRSRELLLQGKPAIPTQELPAGHKQRIQTPSMTPTSKTSPRTSPGMARDCIYQTPRPSSNATPCTTPGGDIDAEVATTERGAPIWMVVSGAKTEQGVIVREGKSLNSKEAPERLAAGALVEELRVSGNRLCFKLLFGSGPAGGWVSLVDEDFAIMRKCTKRQPGQRAPVKTPSCSPLSSSPSASPWSPPPMPAPKTLTTTLAPVPALPETGSSTAQGKNHVSSVAGNQRTSPSVFERAPLIVSPLKGQVEGVPPPPGEGAEEGRTLGHFIGTSTEWVSKMIELVDAKDGDLFLDLGCGSGELLLEVVKQTACSGFGVDVDEKCIKTAKRLSKEQSLTSKLTFRCMPAEDLFVNYGNMIMNRTIVYVYVLGIEQNPRVEYLLHEVMFRGAKILSHQFKLPNSFGPPKIQWPDEDSEFGILDFMLQTSGVCFYLYQGDSDCLACPSIRDNWSTSTSAGGNGGRGCRRRDVVEAAWKGNKTQAALDLCNAVKADDWVLVNALLEPVSCSPDSSNALEARECLLQGVNAHREATGKSLVNLCQEHGRVYRKLLNLSSDNVDLSLAFGCIERKVKVSEWYNTENWKAVHNTVFGCSQYFNDQTGEMVWTLEELVTSLPPGAA